MAMTTSARARAFIVATAIATTTLGGLAETPPAQAHNSSNQFKQRNHIDQRSRSMIGTPYRSSGSTPAGFDCSGFTQWVYAGHGAELPRTSTAQFQLGSQPGFKRIQKIKNLNVGDLVFHKTTSAAVGHVGIYVGHRRFISATSSEGVQIRSLDDPYYWGSRWVGGVRPPVNFASYETPSQSPEEPRPHGRSRTVTA